MISFEVRSKIKQLRETPGVQNRLKQYFRYRKKYNHIVTVGKIIIAFILLMVVMSLFRVLFKLGIMTKILIVITAFVSVLIPIYVLPIYFYTKHERNKYHKQLHNITQQHHLEKYTSILINLRKEMNNNEK